MSNAKIDELRKKIEQLEKEIAKDKEKKNQSLKKSLESTHFIPKEIFYKWKSPIRYFVKRDRPWFVKASVVALTLIIVAAFFQDVMLVLTISVISLLLFLLATVKPDDVTHELSNKGITTMGKFYKWEDLKDFYVCKKYSQKIVFVSTNLKIPGRISFLVNDGTEEKKVVKIIGKFLDYAEIPEKQSWLNRLTEGDIVNPDVYLSLYKKKISK